MLKYNSVLSVIKEVEHQRNLAIRQEVKFLRELHPTKNILIKKLPSMEYVITLDGKPVGNTKVHIFSESILVQINPPNN